MSWRLLPACPPCPPQASVLPPPLCPAIGPATGVHAPSPAPQAFKTVCCSPLMEVICTCSHGQE